MYYLIQNNKITAFDKNPFPVLEGETLLQTDKEIIRAWDGNFYIKGTEPVQPNEQQMITIKNKLDALDKKYAPTMRTLRNAIAGDKVAINIVKQKNVLHESDEEILSLRAELANLEKK